MNETVLKKGYYIEVTSWENDGDDYETLKKYCATEEIAQFLLALAEKHTSTNDRGLRAGIGNIQGFGEAKESVVEDIRKILETAPLSVKQHFKYDTLILDKLSNREILKLVQSICTDELFGVSEWYLFRVFDSGKILKVNEDVNVERIV